ncbi:MAG: PTS sugar transporter subunit IIA [Deltaproteobacteria bacterium]|mgnify:CR=1 FL=1|nr:PTS sugar transporter subunit IIA [Deltaproteobacteria bacterium]
MKLAPFLKDAVIAVKVHTPSVDSLFRTLSEEFYESGVKIDVDIVVRELLKRESSCSTGIGKGLAIPHATIESLDKTYMAIATLADPIDFKSIDKRPVKLVIVLISPPAAVDEHIALLARISRLCSKDIFIELLSQSEDKDDLVQLILEEDERCVG